ncbi:MAG TPA: NAD-dependent protein deacylase [Candidatus Polarisedimenticolaceae bacterium]|nr:NAD-dependent protein deacylase [Candidatus Polarisedimenticolaceae bacterium]
MDPIVLSVALRRRLAGPGPIVALTGAGVSAESGLATFRGPGGLWKGHEPQDLATPGAFARDPLLVWRFYAWRRACAAAALPNPAHHALAALSAARPETRIVTQNVDGLHERAGTPDVLRLHGSLWRLRCVEEGEEHEDLRGDLGPLPPRCACGALLRPAVVWFGEALPPGVLAAAQAAVRQAAVLLVAGTSSLVWPAAGLPGIARAAGVHVVEINPEPTPLSDDADEVLRLPAGRALPVLAAAAGAALGASA